LNTVFFRDFFASFTIVAIVGATVPVRPWDVFLLTTVESVLDLRAPCRHVPILIEIFVLKIIFILEFGQTAILIAIQVHLNKFDFGMLDFRLLKENIFFQVANGLIKDMV